MKYGVCIGVLWVVGVCAYVPGELVFVSSLAPRNYSSVQMNNDVFFIRGGASIFADGFG
jgi:hypothetical protein